jgi:hypothetical protein
MLTGISPKTPAAVKRRANTAELGEASHMPQQGSNTATELVRGHFPDFFRRQINGHYTSAHAG